MAAAGGGGRGEVASSSDTSGWIGIYPNASARPRSVRLQVCTIRSTITCLSVPTRRHGNVTSIQEIVTDRNAATAASFGLLQRNHASPVHRAQALALTRLPAVHLLRLLTAELCRLGRTIKANNPACFTPCIPMQPPFARHLNF
ncbi:hypothetical protein L1887_62385 [Cichorium endivia]|nr:hypothetical protein L1887_62385 [Cichorium endivia]